MIRNRPVYYFYHDNWYVYYFYHNTNEILLQLAVSRVEIGLVIRQYFILIAAVSTHLKSARTKKVFGCASTSSLHSLDHWAEVCKLVDVAVD